MSRIGMPGGCAAEIILRLGPKIVRSGRVLAVVLACGLTWQAGAAPVPMSPVDMVELTRLSHPTLSPDGRYALYLRSEVHWDVNKEVNRYRLIDLKSETGQALFAAENAEESFKRPVWAPDGKGFVSILKREGNDYDQAYFFDLSSHVLTRLTDHDEDVEDVTWVPDGKGFYFRSKAALPEEYAAQLEDDWAIMEYETRQAAAVWHFDLQTGKRHRIIGGDFHVHSYALSRDGSKIIYVRADGGLSDDRHLGELWIHDLGNNQARQVTENAFAESKAKLSPDNRTFAFIATVNEKGEPYYEDNLFVQPIDGKEPTLLMPDAALEVLDFDWDQSGNGLFIIGNTGVRTHLYRYDLATSALTGITAGDTALGEWSYSATTDAHLFLKRTERNPGEVFMLRTGDADARQLSAEYADFPSKFELPKQAVVNWRGRGRVQLEGLLIYPLDYRPDEFFPLVTITHGGPRTSAQFGSWNVSRYVPVLAGQGYGVFLPNHRGGAGYGDRFLRAMVGGYFTHSHEDVLDGIDALVERGLADPDRLIKMGWSAGGHMTNKLITVTDRFRAASSGAGASDWVSMYGETDIRYNRTLWFGGTPWQQRAPLRKYLQQSPLKDAWRVKTPTLFLVGEKDVRVPPTQVIMMYRGVKAAGVQTELFIAKDQPHAFRAPSFRLFKINKELEWYARHLGRELFAPVYPEAGDLPDNELSN